MRIHFFSEFCAPVVVTLVSAEAEKICLKNGLLLHELLRFVHFIDYHVTSLVDYVVNFLSCFGHLDGIGANIRAGNQTFPLSDAHIRFERATEVRPKTSENIEEVCVFPINQQYP